jgi:putative SOS response-associated peptidase YedK
MEKSPEGKIPYSIEMKDAFPFVFAGLWDGWQNPDTKEWLRSCVIITSDSGRTSQTRMVVSISRSRSRLPLNLILNQSGDRFPGR